MRRHDVIVYKPDVLANDNRLCSYFLIAIKIKNSPLRILHQFINMYLAGGIRKIGETILQALGKTPVNLPYQQEPQGEAITFTTRNTGYFTLSEKALASSVKLYFYKRK